MNGKKKGSSFERSIAQQLSLWLTRGASKKELIRSVLSGGWTPGQVGGDFRQVGDLAPNGPVGEKFRKAFAVECKHRRSISAYDLFTDKPAKESLLSWWKKLADDSAAAGVEPMLIWRENGQPIMVAMYCDGVEALVVGYSYALLPCSSDRTMIVFRFQDLLQLNPDRFVW